MLDGTVTTAAGRPRPPVWVWPSVALGLLYPALARSARQDVELLGRLPDPPTSLRRLPDAYTVGLIGLTVAVAVIFSLFRLGITNIYSESMLFLLLALAIGMASPAAGMLLVLLHIPFDLVASSGSYGELEPLLPAVAGRAVSWWLLWLLVVAIPLMARALPGATLASGQPADPSMRRALAYLAGALAAGVLLFMWVAAAPFMLRPAFTWTSMGYPTVPAIQPIQVSGTFIIIAGVAFVLLVTWLRDRFAVLDEEAVELSEPDAMDDIEGEPLVSDQVEFVGRIAAHVVTVILLGGLVTGAVDVVLIFGAALAGQLIAGRLSSWPAFMSVLGRVPWFIRFLGAFALSYLVGLLISNIVFEPALGSEFFPVVLTVAIALAIFQVFLGATAPPPQPEADKPGPAPMGAGTAALVAFVVAGAALFALPGVAAADNCSGWGDDCPKTVEAAASAGAGAAAVVAVGAALAAARLDEQRRRRRPRRRRPQPPSGPGGVGGAGGVGIPMLVDRALRNYGKTRPAAAGSGEMKLEGVGPAEGKEMKFAPLGPVEGKEMKLEGAQPVEGKEMKLEGAQPAEGKEMKLGDIGPAEGKEMKLGDIGPAEGKEMKLEGMDRAEGK